MIKLKSILKEIYLKKSKFSVHPSENPGSRVSTALYILGVDPSMIYGLRNPKKGIKYNSNTRVSGSIWSRSDEYMWEVLEMAKNNYMKLIKQFHPDIVGKEGEEKSKQLNIAWKIIQKAFSKRGYQLP